MAEKKNKFNKLLIEANEFTEYFFGQNLNVDSDNNKKTIDGVTGILNTSNEAVILPEPSKQTDKSKIVATLKESGPVNK